MQLWAFSTQTTVSLLEAALCALVCQLSLLYSEVCSIHDAYVTNYWLSGDKYFCHVTTIYFLCHQPAMAFWLLSKITQWVMSICLWKVCAFLQQFYAHINFLLRIEVFIHERIISQKIP